MTDEQIDQFIQSRGGLAFPDMVFRKDSEAYFTTDFGIDRSTSAVASIRIHQGTDRAKGRYGQVFAPFSGHFVIETSSDFGTVFRLFVEDEFEIRVGHMKLQDIVVRDRPEGKIEAGELIGLAGSEGKSTGPHTHTEVVSIHGESRLCETIIKARSLPDRAFTPVELQHIADDLWPSLHADMVRKGVVSVSSHKLKKIDVWSRAVQTFYDSKALFQF